MNSHMHRALYKRTKERYGKDRGRSGEVNTPNFILDLSRQGKAGNTANLNSFHFTEKELLRWNLNPQHTAYKADALPTEVLMQLSCPSRIKAVQGESV